MIGATEKDYAVSLRGVEKDGQKLSVHVACGHKKRHYAQKTRRFSLGYYWAGKFRSSYLFEYVCRIECVVKCRYDKQDEERNKLTLRMRAQ